MVRVRSTSLVIPTCVLALAATAAAAADWHQWRGPNRDGKSPETGLLQEWPEGGPPLVWRTSGLGAGYSSLSVVGERIFTLGDLEDGQYALAVSVDGGNRLWKQRVGQVHDQDEKRPGPRSTPTFDAGRLYAITTDGDLVCLDAGSGEERWRRSLGKDFDGYLMRAMGSYEWRFSESPLVDGDRVVVTPGHVQALMVALHKETGEEIWRTAGRRLGPIGADGAGYSSAVISEAAGTRQYVQLVGRGLIGVEAETGKLLWSYNRVASDIANIATPIVSGDHVFASAGYGTGSALIKIRRDDEGFHADEAYFLTADVVQNHHGELILHQGTVYTGTGHNKGFPIAVDFLSGEVRWGPERNAGLESAAVIYADGRLYFRYRDGRMILVEATPEAYRERGTFLIPDVEKQSWVQPVIAGGQLYLREQDNLFRYDVRAGAPAAETR